MIFALVVFLAMVPMDICSAARVRFLTTGHPWWASHAELVSDQAGALSYGVGGAALFRYGFSWTTALILLALALASEIGTHLGYRISQEITSPSPD